MKFGLKQVSTTIVAALAIQGAQAHNVWVDPSTTVLEKAGYIAVSGSAGNEMFAVGANNHPLRNLGETLSVIAPDGSQVKPENVMQGKLRSVLDLNLTQNGTYHLSVINSGVSASWKEGSETKRFRGDAASFAKSVPAQAQDLKVSESLGRIETFVTVGKPTSVKASGDGLEMIPVTHPNSMLAGQTSVFRFDVNGKPARGLEVVVVRDGVRYREKKEEIKLITDAQGKVSVTWPQAGKYWLDTDAKDDKTTLKQVKERQLSYVVTLEVLDSARLAVSAERRAKQEAERAAKAPEANAEKR